MTPDPSAKSPAQAAGHHAHAAHRAMGIFTHRLAWTVLCLSLVASTGGWFIARMHDDQTASKRFDAEISRIQTALEERMSIYETVLHGGLGLYAASHSVERSEWKAYVQTVSGNQRLPGIDGLGFIAEVPRATLDDFLKATREDDAPAFQLRNPGTNADYFITKYLEPEAAHADLLGVDAGANPQGRALAEQARDSGQTAVAGQMDLPGPGKQNVFLMLLPVFRNGAPAETLEQRRANLTGWVFVRFDLAGLMGGSERESTLLVRFQIKERQAGGSEALIFDSDPPANGQGNSETPMYSDTKPLNAGNNLWVISYASKPEFDHIVSRSPEWLAAAGGGVISLLLFGIALVLSATRARARRMADEMTDAYRQANTHLQKEIEERKRGQKNLQHEQFLLRTLMEHLPDRIYFKDLQSRFMRNSRAHLARFGLTKASEAIGKTDFDFFSEEHARQAYEDEQRLIRSGGQVNKEEKETWPDGSVTWALSTKMVLRDEAGEIVGTFGISRDITARKQAEEAMREARDVAEAASRTKSQFLANMSHELRTPLNSVIGFASILMKNKTGNLTAADLNFLERIQANGKHLLALINEILDLSKIEARKVELQLTAVALDTLVRETIAQQEGLVRDRPVRLLAELPDQIAPIQADADKLRQVIINLISNALKFTEQGSVTVRVVTGPGNQPERIDVIDTGIGIPSEKLGLIFDAFQQADASTSRKYGGTGLGLTISQALCHLMGYYIEVTSEVGRGSIFSVVLGGKKPVTPVPGKPTIRPQPGKITIQSSRLRGRFILVIDDESDSRILLTHMLEEFGCQVISASSGEQGLRMAREFRPHLITVDLLMPGMDGASVIRAIKADPELSAIPIVVVSIVAEERRGTILGAVDILVKPVVRDQLQAALRRNLQPARTKVLVVDDAEDARAILLAQLADEKLEVRTAANGKVALAVLKDFTPDLILLDLMMPEMDGMAFLAALRTEPRHQQIPVIVITAKELSLAEKEDLRRQTLEIVKKSEVSEEKFKQLLLRIVDAQSDDDGHPPAASA